MSIVSKSLLSPQWMARLRKIGRGRDEPESKAPKKDRAALDKGAMNSHLSGMVTERPNAAAPGAPAPAVTLKPWRPTPPAAEPQTPATIPAALDTASSPAGLTPPPVPAAAAPAPVTPPAPAATSTPAQAPTAEAPKPAAKDDDLRQLFTEDDAGNEELRKLASFAPVVTARELAAQAREVLALFPA